MRKKMRHETYLKTGLSPYDDKRYVLNDKVSTLAYGHYLCTLDNDFDCDNFELC
jgi:hypothetical protein